MRGIVTIVFMTSLASLQSQRAVAADCKLQLLHKVQMTRAANGLDMMPVVVNGTSEPFLFDTGGSLTQINRPRCGAAQAGHPPGQDSDV